MELFLATFKQFSLLILITMLLTVAGSIMYYFYITVSHDMDDYRAEGECISQLVSTGVPRKDIQSSNGTCSVIKKG